MARIYKESRYVLQLLIGKSYGAQYDDVKISFYTKNPSNQVMVDNDITIKRNIAEVKIESTLFDNLEDGLIKYIVYGTKDGIPFIEERISNYFLKTPLDFKPGESGTTCNLGVLDWALTSPSTEVKNASDDGYDGYSQVTIRPENVIAQEKENAINDFKNKMKEITITQNGTYSIDDQETRQYVEFDGNSYFDTNIPFGENTKIEVAILKTTYEEDEPFIGCAQYSFSEAETYGGFGIVAGAGLVYGVFGGAKTTNIPFSYEEEQILTLDKNGIHSSFGNGAAGWIDNSKLNNSPIYSYGYTIGIGKIKSASDGWMYRGLKGRIRYVKIWTNKDDDSTMTLFRPKNMAQGGFGLVNSGGTEYNYVENIGTGTTTFVEEWVKKYPNGFKRVEANVTPKINVQEASLKFSHSSFTEVPEWADFDGITDTAYMFYECNSLETIPLIDTSNVTGMSFMFGHCHKLQTIPLIDTSNVIYMNNMFSFCIELQTIPLINTSNVTRMDNMFSNCSLLQTIPQIDTSNVTDMSHMFDNCFNLQTIPSIDTSNVTEMNYMFTYCQKLQTLPKFNCQKVTDMTRYFTKTSGGMSSLTDVGGWENLKCNWDDVYGLATCPNLTYQSCINILNGLYDFVGNGSTETRTLRVHPNFLTTVGDEISIGTNKGWQITA